MSNNLQYDPFLISVLGAFAIWRKATVRFVMSVSLSAASRRIFMKFDICTCFEKLSTHTMQVSLNRTTITGTSHHNNRYVTPQ